MNDELYQSYISGYEQGKKIYNQKRIMLVIILLILFFVLFQ